jgi:hypothetical protein
MSHAETPAARCSRRDALWAGGLGLTGLYLPMLWAQQARCASHVPTEVDLPRFGQAKRCIFLFMWGGPAHQDTWDLKPQAPREIRGEFSPIATRVPGIQICEHFPSLAQQTHRLAIIRSMTHDNVDHTRSTHYLLTGQAPPPTLGDFRHDWVNFGNVMSRLGRGEPPLPPFITMRPKVPGDVPRFVEESHGQFGGWLGAEHRPMIVDANPALPDYHVGDFSLPNDLLPDRFARRWDILRRLEQGGLSDRDATARVMQQHYERAASLLASDVAQEAFNLDAESTEVRDRYGRNPHGQAVLQARRLIERGVGLVTVFWPNDGIKNVSVYWDTHSRNFIDLKERLMPVADQAFSALLDDLADRGLLDETLVIWSGEFGRTPRIGQVNSDAGAGADGRDHWPGCFTSVLAGGGVSGGQVYGASDRFAAYPAVNPTRPVDLAATVYHLLGIPPHTELRDRENRPLVICPGDVIPELLMS